MKLSNKIRKIELLPDNYLHEDIAIIGMACRFPGAENYQQYWKNIINRASNIKEVPMERWDVDQYYSSEVTNANKSISKWGGFLNNITSFDADFFNISPCEAEIMDPQQKILLELSWACLEEAGYIPSDLEGSKTGVFIGACNFDYKELLNSNVALVEGHTATGTYNTMLANRISYFYDFRGPSVTLDTACASSLFALNQAIQSLKFGECSLALAGGVSILCTPTSYISFSKSGMLSPSGQCHSFDANADGYVRGEGAGLILLKSLSQALEDGDRIEGIIKGHAVNHGGRVRTLTSPNPYMQAQVIEQAWKKANVDPREISYIEAHGTGTPLGDPIEIHGLQKAFNQMAKDFNIQLPEQYCGIGTVKTNIGHLEAAAGIAGIIKVLLAFRHGLLPPLQNFQLANPKIKLEGSPFYLVDKTREWQSRKDAKGIKIPRYAGVSSFGFGGANAHIALEEGPAYAKASQQTKPSYLLTISAKHPDSLKKQINDLHSYLKEYSDLCLENIAYTLNLGRSHFNYRCAIVVSSLGDLQNTLEQIQQGKKLNHYLIFEDKTTKEEDSISNEILDRLLEGLSNQLSNSNIYHKKLLLLADFYIKGYKIDWEVLHQGENHHKISLPTYPFVQERHWASEYNITPSQLLPTNEEKNNAETSQGTNASDGVQIITRIIAESLKVDPLKLFEDEPLNSFGIDSILFLIILRKCNQVFDVNIKLDELVGVNTIRSLENLYSSKQDKRQKASIIEQDSLILVSSNNKKNEMLTKYQTAFLNFDQLKLSLIKTSQATSIEVIRAGVGDPIVFLPPIDSISTAWRSQFLEFTKGYQVISFHYPGYGISDFTYESANLNCISDTLIEILDNLNINAPVHLVGWSMGGLIAQITAIKHRDRIKTLTLVNTTSKLMYDNNIDSSILVFKILEKDFNQHNSNVSKKSNLTINATHIKGADNLDIFVHYVNEVFKHDYRNKIKNINVPTLIFAGGQDQLTTSKDAIYMHNEIKNSVYCLLESEGHYIPLFNPDFFNEKFNSFLQEFKTG